MATTKVAIQGQPASFHDVAARKYFGNDIELVYCDLPFDTVFDALRKGEAQYAVCAIENTVYGSIREVRSLIEQYSPDVLGTVNLPIEQCLIGVPGASLADITEVYSHPVAIAQCADFLASILPEARRIASDDTAGSVADIADWKQLDRAAIASEAAAKLYGMNVLKKGIQNDKDNVTRFVVLALDASTIHSSTEQYKKSYSSLT